MNTTHPLSGAHLRTYETIFQHPISHNLEWRSVRALLEHLGEVVEASNGNLKVTRNGQTLVLHRANTKDVGSADEVMSLRHFLKKSEPVAPAAEEQETQWLQTHHPEVSRRIVGSQVVDGNHLSNDELLAKERDFFLNLPPAAIPSAGGDGSGQTSEQSIQTKPKE
jgi:hypothetical protein